MAQNFYTQSEEQVGEKLRFSGRAISEVGAGRAQIQDEVRAALLAW